MSSSYNLLVSGSILSPTRKANSWNVAASYFLGNTAFAYSTKVDFIDDIFVNSSENLVYSITSTSNVSTYKMDTSKDISNLYLNSSNSVYVPLSGTFRSVALSNTGNSLILSSTSNSLFQYALSNNWDVSSASLIPGDNYIQLPCVSHLFSSDGLTLYTLNSQGVIRSYSLPSAYQISSPTLTASFSSGAKDFYIRPDGAKMYILNSGNDTVYEYTLTTPWDISTATYYLPFLYIGGQEPSPTRLSFRPDGTAMYILGTNKQQIYYYRLFVAWDASSAVSQGAVLNLQEPAGFADDFFITDDGYNIFVTTGEGYSVLRKYVCTTAWDLMSVPKSSPFNYAIADQTYYYGNTISRDSSTVNISSDGSTIVLSSSLIVSKGSLGTAWDLSTANISSKDGGINVLGYLPASIDIDRVETKMYILSGTGYLYEYPLSNGFNIANMSSSSGNVYVGSRTCISLNYNNSDIYMGYNLSSSVYRYKMSSPLDISTLTLVNTLSVSGTASSVGGIYGTQDNANLYIASINKDMVFNYDLIVNPANTRITINTASNGKIFLSSSLLSVSKGLVFSPDGSRFFVIDSVTGRLLRYTLSTPWDINSLSLTNSTVIGSNSTTTKYFYIDRNGRDIYSVEAGIFSTNAIYSTLGAPWSATGDTYITSYTMPSGLYENIIFKPDGTKYYASNVSHIAEYSMSTPWDVTNASLSYSVVGNFSNSMYIHPSGTNLYLANGYNIVGVAMSNAWDLTSNSYPSILYTQNQSSNVTGISISNDGNKLYLLDGDRTTIYQYPIGL